MRMSKFALFLAVSAGSALALPGLTNPASAAQDTPTTINGVETVCTGVGSAKDDPRWNDYPVKLTFSNMAGENEAFEHVAVTQQGKTLLQTDCDAPWLLIKLPAGHYSAHASLPGRAGTRTANADFTAGGGQKTVNLAFPSQRQAAAQ